MRGDGLGRARVAATRSPSTRPRSRLGPTCTIATRSTPCRSRRRRSRRHGAGVVRRLGDRRRARRRARLWWSSGSAGGRRRVGSAILGAGSGSDRLRASRSGLSSSRPCCTRRETSAPSIVSRSSSACATRSRPRRCFVSSSRARSSCIAQDPLDLFVDDAGGLVGVVTRVHEVLAEEHLALRAPRHRADAVAHAPLAHHAAGQLGVDLTRSFWRRSTPCRTRAPRRCGHPGACTASPRCRPGCAVCRSSGSCWVTPSAMPVGEDRDLVQRVGVRRARRRAPRGRPRGRRSRSFSSLGEHHRLAPLRPSAPGRAPTRSRCARSPSPPRRTANSAASLTRLARSAPLMPGVPRATISRSTSGPMLLVLRVHLEDRQALLELGQRHDDLAVEAAGAQQRGVEDVGPVGGRHHHDALGGLEAVHLGEHLVEGLLTLVVAAAEAGAALAADRVDLVDEDDRPAELAGRAGTGRARGWRRRRRTSP